VSGRRDDGFVQTEPSLFADLSRAATKASLQRATDQP
jgi:hypothetical protein